MTSPLRGRGGAVWAERELVRVTGADAASFLQGQLSQDIEAIDVGHTVRSLLLAPQGHVVAWLRVTRTEPEAFVLDCDPGDGERVMTRLRRFLLRVDAAVEPLDWRGLSVRHGLDVSTPAVTGEVVVATDWPGVGGVDVFGPAVTVPEGLAECTTADLETLRVECGVPRSGFEIDETTIPNSLPMLAAAVNFTKGCYVGQELVARIDSRGNNVPQRLVAWRADRALSIGEDLVVPSSHADAGRVTSAVESETFGPVGLAYVKRGIGLDEELTTSSGARVELREVPSS